MMTKHKHCDLIKAWADGESIQYLSPVYKKWIDFEEGQTILWNLEKYRIKPKLWIPKKELSFKEISDIEKTKLIVKWVHEFCSNPVLRFESNPDYYKNKHSIHMIYYLSQEEIELFDRMAEEEQIAI